MVVAENLGPLSPVLDALAESLHRTLYSVGLPTPAPALLPDAILFTLVTFVLSFALNVVLPALLSRDARDSVLIVGISGEGDSPAVGKTTLFHALRYGRAPKLGTVPSQVANVATFSPMKPQGTEQQPMQQQRTDLPPARWVDFPGHPRLRHGLAAELKRARAIVVVTDAQRFAAQARRDAALLHDVLTNPHVARSATPVLIWLNRPTALSQQAARTRLEAELQRARVAASANGALRAAAVGGTDGDDEDDPENERVPLGYENEPFSFDHAPGPVTLGAGCAISGEVDDVLNFVQEALA